MYKKLFTAWLTAAVLLMGACLPALAQNRVTGKVLDAGNGEPVIGASVLVPGTTRGAVTGLDGGFEINAAEGTRLLVSCIGYTDQEVTVRGTGLTIHLEASSEFLDDVVVVGYGTVKKENLTGAVDQVGSEQFENRPVGNVTQMLVGAIPNLNIDLADGKPNRTASYNVRGTTSIGTGGSALVLIDGVEGDPALINPNDIESVSVLKDAASSAIYGSRAPYGVVLITTKNPAQGKDRFSISYSGNVAVMRPVAVPDIVDDGFVYASLFYEAWQGYNTQSPTGINNSQDFSLAWLDAFKERKESGNTLQTTVNSDGKYVYYGDTNYYDYLYKDNVFAQTHNVSASGSSGKVSYYFSGRLYDYDGLFKYHPDTYRTLNLRSKTAAQLKSWLKFTENIEYTHDKSHIPVSSNKEGGGVVWRQIADQGHPSEPVFNPDGTLTMSGARSVGGLILGGNYMDRLTKTFKTTSSLQASFLDNRLQASVDYSYRSRDYTQNRKYSTVPYSTYEGKISYLGTPGTEDTMSETLQQTGYQVVNAYASFEDTFAGKHAFKALAGYNYEEQAYKSTTFSRNDPLTSDIEQINLYLGEEMTTSSGWSKWRYAGLFFRLNYAYDDRYLFEVNGRYDGSSKFPDNAQWGFFPSASAAWRVSQEHWWKVDPALISNLKIRGSYGELGNSNVSPYSFVEKFSLPTLGTGVSNDARILDGSTKLRYTSAPSQIPDNLGWERSRTLDGGLDAGFYNGKVNLTADYYVRKTLDMFTVGPTLPDTFGASAPKGNYADMSTYGWELSLSYNDSFTLAGKPFNFGVKGTLSDFYTIVDKYNNDTRKLSDYYEGQRLGEIWGFVSNGLLQSQEEIDNAWDGAGYVNNLIRFSLGYVPQPGDIRYEDLNGNHKIDNGSGTVDDPGDRKVIGNSLPRYLYSISLNGDWNGLFFSAMFQGVGRQDWYPSGESTFWGQYNRPYNQALKWMVDNYWTPEHPDAYLPRYSGYNYAFYKGSDYPCDRYLQDVSYIRLKNIQVGYQLPAKWVRKVGLSAVSVYFSGENLWTWSPMYKWARDFDVVTVTKSSDSDISTTRGDGSNYPSMRSCSFGITITY